MIMSNKDIEEYHNIGLDTATKVFNKFKDGTLPWLELDIDFKKFISTEELNSVDPVPRAPNGQLQDTKKFGKIQKKTMVVFKWFFMEGL